MGLLLSNASWWSNGREGRGDLRIARGKIVAIAAPVAPRRGDTVVDLEGHWVLPGLINAHDHLGLDLLPRLGHPPYRSFYDWAEEIYRPRQTPIAELGALAPRDRLAWGGWRNVFGGATVVAHHDPWHGRLFRARRFPVSVLRSAWAHSLGFDASLQRRYRADRPFVVHAAEGVDDRAHAEVAELDRRGVLHPNTVLVHAVALSEEDIALIARRKAKVIWCPVSNERLYGRSAPIAELRRAGVTVALGTDATISGGMTLLEELRQAARSDAITPGELLGMVTHAAASVFGLDDGLGSLALGAPADLVVVRNRGSAPDSVIGADYGDLLLVLRRGRPRLAQPDIAVSAGLGAANLMLDGTRVWVDDALHRLRARIGASLGGAFPHGRLWQAVSGMKERGRLQERPTGGKNF